MSNALFTLRLPPQFKSTLHCVVNALFSPVLCNALITVFPSWVFLLLCRKVRGEAKKCRKVYGIEHRDQWCTACRWKKACQRFLDWAHERFRSMESLSLSQPRVPRFGHCCNQDTANLEVSPVASAEITRAACKFQVLYIVCLLDLLIFYTFCGFSTNAFFLNSHILW